MLFTMLFCTYPVRITYWILQVHKDFKNVKCIRLS